MNIGILALFFALLLFVSCILSRPQEEAHKHVDCRPITAVVSDCYPKEV
jgi:hypothetical protein